MGIFFLIYIAWLTGLFLTGSVISFLVLKSRFQARFYEVVLRNIFLGYIVIIILQSIRSTGFKTVNLVFILILLFALVDARKQKTTGIKKSSAFTFRQFLPLVLMAGLLFIYSWFLIADPGGFLKFSGGGDYILYSKISQFIASTGNENGFYVLNTMDPFYNGPEPYHYFDLWGGACVSNIFGINNFLSLKLIIYPTFYFLYAMGLLAIIDRTNAKSFALTLGLLMIGGIALKFFYDFRFLRDLHNISFNVLHPDISKLSFFYVFIISGHLLYRNNLFTLAFLTILSLPVANIVTLPTILPTLFLILMILFFTKTFSRKIILRCGVYFVLTIVSIVLFYTLSKRQSGGLAGAEITSPLKLIIDTFHQMDFRTQRNIVLASMLGLLIIYCPFVLVLILNRKNHPAHQLVRKVPFLFIIISISFALLAWCILYTELNSSQIYFNLVIPLLNVSFAVYSISLFYESARMEFKFSNRNLSVMFILLLIGYNAFITVQKAVAPKQQLYSFNYLADVEKSLVPNSIVASLKGAGDMQNIFFKYNAVYPLGDYLFLMNKHVQSVNIGDLDTPIDSSSVMNIDRSKKAMQNGIFYRYSRFPENKKIEKDKLMLKFLKEYHIHQMIVSKNARVPDTLLHYVRTLFTDSISGDQFILLDI